MKSSEWEQNLRFTIYRYDSVESTNDLARERGEPGEVFVAAWQSAGRGRLNHRWLAKSGENLLMSVVLPVGDFAPMELATFPLVVGLAVAEAVGGEVKWPNDVYLHGRKISGILCERHDERLVAGIGLNVRQREFPEELAAKATSLVREGFDCSVDAALTLVLEHLSVVYETWRTGGFAALYSRFAALDFLKGKYVSVLRTDEDSAPVTGLCGGIAPDGSLVIGRDRVYAGEVRIGGLTW